jgi:hypothetical protein
MIGVLAIIPGAPLGADRADASVQPATNPDWPAACGVDIAMVLDTSNSIGRDGFGPQMRNAANGFVDAMTGTPSKIGVTYFRGITELGGPGVGGTVINMTDVSSTSGADTVKDAINGVGFEDFGDQGGTNWQKAFQTVGPLSPNPRVVLVLTDGNPTTYNNNPDDLGEDTDQIDIDKGVTEANSVKTTGARIVAVGIGDDISVANLKAISGPVANDDYFTTSFGNLETKLREIAEELCDGTVIVNKWVGDEKADGWLFLADPAPDSTSPSDGRTSNGKVTFKWDLLSAGTQNVTITEEFHSPDYSFVSFTCSSNQSGVVDTGTDPANPIADFALNRGETVTCDYYNARKARIIVDKVTTPSGESEKFKFTLTGGISFSDPFELADGDDPYDSGPIEPGSYSVYEYTPLPTGWDRGPATCDHGNDPDDIEVGPGETVTCTFENTKRGSITVVKNAVGGEGTFEFESDKLARNYGIFEIHVHSGTNSRTFPNLEPGLDDAIYSQPESPAQK